MSHTVVIGGGICGLAAGSSLAAHGERVTLLEAQHFLGGLATSALVYLLVERTLRPLFALALAGDVPEASGALSVRSRLMLL